MEKCHWSTDPTSQEEKMHSRADRENELPDSFVCAFSLGFYESEVGRLDIWVEEHGGERIAKSLPLVVPELKWVVEYCPVLAELLWDAECWVLLIRVGETLEILSRQEEFIPTWDEHLCGMLENFVFGVERIVVREEFWVSEIWSKLEIITLGD